MPDFNLVNHPICFAMPNRLSPITSWHGHIPFAMLLVDLLRPKMIVELGTHRGDSYCAFCQAVKELKLETRCYAVDTWQGDPQAGFYGSEVLIDLQGYHDPLYGSFSRLIKSTFDEALLHFDDASIDILHIDGYHTYEMVKHDFESWLPKLSQNGIILLHDINVRERDYGARKFWDEIKITYPHFEFLHSHGLGVLAVGTLRSEELKSLLNSTGEEKAVVRTLFFQLGRQITNKVLIESNEREIRDLKKDSLEDRKLIELNNNVISDLQTELFQIRNGIPMRIRSRYQKVIEKLLHQGTRRRRYYQLGLKGTRVILNEGWRSFFRKTFSRLDRNRLQNKPSKESWSA